MNRAVSLVFAVLACALAACSGNFATGTGMPSNGGMPPVGPSGAPGPYDQKGNPQGSASPGASASPGVANSGTYNLTDAQTGFLCPSTIEGYSCTLKFNLPAPTPTPAPVTKGKKARATPTPKPTPTPTPSPSPSPSAGASDGASSSASPSASPSATPATIALKTEALPKDAPPMVHTPANSLDVVPLMMVHLTPSSDFVLNGYAQAQFTLPKPELEERGFAVQLFQATVGKKTTTYKPIWTFDKSTLKDQTLTFSFAPPKTTIPKGSTYVLVLYGDDKSKTKTSPATLPSGSASTSPSPAVSSEPGATGSATPATPAASPF